MNIAVKRTIGLGDVILAQPIVAALKSSYLESRVTFFTSESRSCSKVVEYMPEVDRVELISNNKFYDYTFLIIKKDLS